MKSDNKHIKTLDGWRAVAVAAVTLAHLSGSVLPKTSSLAPVFAWMINGVDLFFALSGYLISSKLIAELESSGKINFKLFYLRRVFRLIPAAYTYLSIIFLLSFAGYMAVNNLEFLSILTFWRNYLGPEAGGEYTGHFWSLTVEEHFYFFLPAFLFFLRKPKKIIFSTIALGVFVALWRKAGTIDHITNMFPYMKFTMWSTIGRFDALLYGVLLGYVHKYCLNITNILKKIHPIIAMLLIFLVAYFPIPFRPVFEALLFPLLIFTTVSNDKSLVSNFLELRYMKYIGTISYSIYIWQGLFVYKMVNAPKLLQSITGEWHSLIFILLASMASYHIIENPVRKWGAGWMKSQTKLQL